MADPTFTITHGDFATWQLRARENNYPLARMDLPHSRWGRAPLRLLTAAYPSDSDVWVWLREHGAARTSLTSGPSTPEGERGNVQIKLRVEKVVAARMKSIAAARGVTVSGLVTDLVARAK